MQIDGAATIGKCQILRELSRGGMAVVYEALDVSLNRRVALKVLAEHLTHDTGFVARFRTEAQAAAALSHPNIVTIYEVGEDGGKHYIAMEYLESDLEERIAQRGALSVDDTVRIALQVAAGLEAAHSRGIVHRDIKPSNIMFDAHGQPKIVDFGIVRMLEGTRLTSMGMSVGTPEYMSPEQAAGGAVDHRTDIYSLGIVMYEMLTGQAPFTASTPLAVAYMHRNEPALDVRACRPDVPEWLAQTIHHCLTKAPQSRWPSCRELEEALATRRVTMTPSPTPASAPSLGWSPSGPVVVPLPAPAHRGGGVLSTSAVAVAAAAATLLVCLCVVAVVLHVGSDRRQAELPPPPPSPPTKSDDPATPERSGTAEPAWPNAREVLESAGDWPNAIRSSGNEQLDRLRTAIYTRNIMPSELDGLAPDQVCVLRNEPFGRNGYPFATAHLREFLAGVGYGVTGDTGSPGRGTGPRIEAIKDYQGSRGGDHAVHLRTPH